uniref:Uncharacterized protein n=1 Tax=mine drainage metagenome TaxID=410659 RepID=E6PXI9_9ZZZZ
MRPELALSAERVFAHNNETLGVCGDLLHNELLVDIWLTENSMESRLNAK